MSLSSDELSGCSRITFKVLRQFQINLNISLRENIFIINIAIHSVAVSHPTAQTTNQSKTVTEFTNKPATKTTSESKNETTIESLPESTTERTTQCKTKTTTAFTTQCTTETTPKTINESLA